MQSGRAGRDPDRGRVEPVQQCLGDLERAHGPVPLPGQRAVVRGADPLPGRECAARMGRRTGVQRGAVAVEAARRSTSAGVKRRAGPIWTGSCVIAGF